VKSAPRDSTAALFVPAKDPNLSSVRCSNGLFRTIADETDLDGIAGFLTGDEFGELGIFIDLLAIDLA
jgi:hypothetical protein